MVLSRVTSLAIALAGVAVAACGGDDGPGPVDTCGFASDRYLPFEVGFTWSYRITDLGTGEVATKDQSVDEMLDDASFGPVLVQTTGKLSGSTRSLFSVDGDRLVRRQQEDFDAAALLERTTTYEPGQLRIDESAARLTLGASWAESYTETETPAGGAPTTLATVDQWEVLGVDVECSSPLGSFQCVRLRRARTQGGIATKEFYFAPGIGKVRETGDNQLEELAACAAP